jgi:hypothetical protein
VGSATGSISLLFFNSGEGHAAEIVKSKALDVLDS